MFANAKEYLREWFHTGGFYLLIAALFALLAIVIFAVEDAATAAWQAPNQWQKLVLLVLSQYKTLGVMAALFIVASFLFPPFHKIFEKVVIVRMVGIFEQGFGSLTTALQEGVRQALGSFDADRRRQAIIQLIETSTSLTAADLAEIGKLGLTPVLRLRPEARR